MKKILSFLVVVALCPTLVFGQSKVEDLTALATQPADTDVIYIVDDPTGTPVGKKIDYNVFVPDASVTVQGIVELATTAETDTGTDATRANTPDGLEASKWTKRYVYHRLYSSATDTATGTTIEGDLRIPVATTITRVGAWVDTAGAGSVTTFDINDGGTSILSTKITIDADEGSSEDAGTAPVISDSALTSDAVITFDVDGVASGTASKGGVIWLEVKNS